jgi:hypothetical protein
MPRVGFEATISVFERAKAFCALDRAPTVTGYESISSTNLGQQITKSDKSDIWLLPVVLLWHVKVVGNKGCRHCTPSGIYFHMLILQASLGVPFKPTHYHCYILICAAWGEKKSND